MSIEGENCKWREDFPIETGADNYVTRREFTKFLVLASGATVVGNGYFVIRGMEQRRESFPVVEIASTDEISPGAVKLFHYPDADEPAILIRLASGDFVAYKQRCTHLSCPVHFSVDVNRIECPCHNGTFDAATGAVLAGPPPRPLPKILIRTEGEKIFAVGVAES